MNILSSSKLHQLSDAELISHGKQICNFERKATVRVIELLEEFDRRKLHLDRSYSSLFEFCVKELRYSRSGATRRISCMRLIKDFGEKPKRMIKEKIESGALLSLIHI